MTPARPQRFDDGLGPNSDIGAKLRALYGSVQDEGIPDRFIDLLEKLDEAERRDTGRPAGTGANAQNRSR